MYRRSFLVQLKLMKRKSEGNGKTNTSSFGQLTVQSWNMFAQLLTGIQVESLMRQFLQPWKKSLIRNGFVDFFPISSCEIPHDMLSITTFILRAKLVTAKENSPYQMSCGLPQGY